MFGISNSKSGNSGISRTQYGRYIGEFFIPMVYLLFVTPLEYVFELYSKYEMLFIRMCFKEPRDKKVKRKRHLKVIKACGLSVRKIILFQKQCIPRMYVSMSDSEFEALISQLEEICQ